MKLIICGNGMDIHLGFNTSYSAYRKYLETMKFINGKSAISIIENSRYFKERSTSCWSDLEQSLSFDFQKYIDDIIETFDRKIFPDDREKISNQITAAQEFQKNNPAEIAFEFTNNWFLQWILKEFYDKVDDISKCYNSVLRKLFIDNSLFLTFNYTPSLEMVFGIDEKNILYIHNRFPHKYPPKFTFTELQQDIIESGRKKFQFGSTRNSLGDWEHILEQVTLQYDEKLIKRDDIERRMYIIYYSFSKQLDNNYDNLRTYVVDRDIDEVVILGHSFLGIDEPYYKDVLVPQFGEKKWIIYWHGSDIEAKNFIDKYHIRTYELKEW